MINYWPLLGIALVVIGFALRFNPLLVVAVAAIVTGLLGKLHFIDVLETLGKGFNDSRFVTIPSRLAGIASKPIAFNSARELIGAILGATAGRLLGFVFGASAVLSARLV